MTPAVARALKDAQQFLPFKSYQVLDSAMIRGADGGTTRVEGPQGVTYSLYLRRIRGAVDIGMTETWGDKPKSIFTTTFQMATGETVVAGTSRLQHGEALVLIVTALADGGK